MEGDFAGVGEPAQNAYYLSRVAAYARPEAIQALMEHTGRVSEIQNMLRIGIPVVLDQIEVVAV